MGSTALDENTAPDLPSYDTGDVLYLRTPVGGSIQVTVIRMISISVSPVLEVQLNEPNRNQKAILKLYDRRVGGSRRRTPYTREAEVAWQDCVRSGLAKELLESFQHEDDMRIARRLGTTNEREKEDSSGEDDEEVDEAQWQEVSLYYSLQRIYKTEVRAFSELQHLQGRYIPRLITSVTETSPKRPADLPDEYFQVPGILLEYIEGFTLAALTAKVPDRPEKWEEVIKQAMSAAEEINNAGVVHEDCQPRNVLVKVCGSDEYQTYFIDFGQVSFKADFKDTEDDMDDDGFLCRRLTRANRVAIALLMMKRIETNTPYKISSIDGVAPYPC